MQLVLRTLGVLRHLAEHPEGQTLVDIATALGAPQPTAHRLLGVLLTEEFVVRSSQKRYSLGPAAISLSRGVRRLEVVAEPHMRALNRRTLETVFLTQMLGHRAVCVALVDGTRPLRLFVRIGQEMPVHAASSARAILAFLPQEELSELLSAHAFTRFTADTPTSVRGVQAHLDLVRLRGYDVCEDELDPNVVAISVPVRAGSGGVIASLTIAAPRERMDPRTRERCTAELLARAEAVSAELGFSQGPIPSMTNGRAS